MRFVLALFYPVRYLPRNDVDECMAEIAAERVVRHLERAGFVVLKKPAAGGHTAIGRGFEG